jgi:hypothetical protein
VASLTTSQGFLPDVFRSGCPHDRKWVFGEERRFISFGHRYEEKKERGKIMTSILYMLMWGITVGLSGGISVQGGWSEEVWAKTTERNDYRIFLMQEVAQMEKKKEGQGVAPNLPPPENDPEMVIKPDVPADPDAVVVPPPIDPEMSVDPATREPMTKEQLEELQEKGSSGEEQPGHGKKSLPGSK